jgi:CheY-like chemotaxis protein
MFVDAWNVLVVDDEPDVLSVSKLAMRKFEVYGLPLRIYTASSKVEALGMLEGELMRQGGYPNLAVAFIDVVMESDTTGLELCQHIRETMRNRLTALYVRTGQPGLAPERTVIDRYDISGYFTKVEATEDKLYSLVTTGVRQYLTTGMSLVHFEVLHRLIAASGSRERMVQTLNAAVSAHRFDASGTPYEGMHYKRWIIADGTVIAGNRGGDEADALALHARLNERPGLPLGREGDKVARDGADLLIKVAGGPNHAEVYDVMTCRFPPPDLIVSILHRFLQSFSTLWSKAR